MFLYIGDIYIERERDSESERERERVLKTFPGPGYLRSEDGLV